MKRKKRKKPKKHNIQLEVGHFYNVHDGSPKGHPGEIVEVNEFKNEFLSVTTHSLTNEEYNEKQKNDSFRKDFKELKQPTTQDVYKSFVHRRPFLGTRDDYGDIEYQNMEFEPEDIELINEIKKKTPRIGYWLKRKKPS